MTEMEVEIDPLSIDLTCHPDIEEKPGEITFEVKIERMNDVQVKHEANEKPDVTAIVTKIEDLVYGYQMSQPGMEVVKDDQSQITSEIDGVKEEEVSVKLKVKKKKEQPKKKKRLYNQKVDENFQQEENPDGILYYACAVCDIKYTTVEGLYNHVLGHKNRLTSWDLRVKNLKLKKKRKKEEKRLKKAQIRQEGVNIGDGAILPSSLPEFVGNVSGNVANLDVGNQNNSAQSTDGLGKVSNVTNLDVGNQNNGAPITDGLEKISLPVNVEKQNATFPSSGKQDKRAPKSKDKAKKEKKAKDSKEGEINMELDEKQREALNLEKIFKCGQCNKQFHLGYYLKLHVRSHTGEKPYSCEECGISFITASKLGRHRKRTHLSVRFVCRVCRRPYTRLEFLTRHFNKQHQADKIEGEPYDYNAILPYLKELEEELQRKKEAEEAMKKEPSPDFFEAEGPERKPKIEELWTFNVDGIKQEFEVQTWPAVKTEIKVEAPDAVEDPGDSFVDDAPPPDAPPEPKDEDESDDDEYFPSDTWLPTPSPAPATPAEPPPRPRRINALRTGRKGGNPLQCDVCNKTVSTVSYLRIHMRTHTGDKPYKCYLCSKSFITSSKRNRHVMTHNNWEDECKDKLKNGEPGGVKEEPGSDPEEGTVLAKLAKKARRPRRLRKTLERLSVAERRDRKKPYACHYCCSRFGYPEALQLHMHSHQIGEKPSRAGDAPADGFVCRYCMAVFDDEDKAVDHEMTHKGPKPYLCTLCGRSYKKKETLIYHRRLHDNPDKYQCDVCPKSFNLLCKLQRHLHSHRPDKYVVRYECPVCAHIFNTRYHIEMHLTTHEKEGVIQADRRGEIIAMVMQNARKIPLDTEKTTTSLKNLVPTDERSRICNICGEIFNHFYYLEQHLKTHGSTFSVAGHEDLDERKYICKVCNKGFKLSYYLKLHSYTHTKEKPYICQQCGKGFITRGKLKRHLETHTGVKKYQCHICCKFFTRPSYLRIHVRTIHGNQDYNFKSDLEYDMVGSLPLSEGVLSVISDGV